MVLSTPQKTVKNSWSIGKKYLYITYDRVYTILMDTQKMIDAIGRLAKLFILVDEISDKEKIVIARKILVEVMTDVNSEPLKFESK